MFSKNKKAPKQPAQQRSVPSIISADLKVVGDLSSTGEIQVDGQVHGDIATKVLLVGETAHIKGEIRAETVQVHGRVDGQIKATNVNLAKTAHVVGDILHENLSIKEGAFLEGHMTHMSEKPKVPEAPKPEAEKDGKPAEDRVNLVVKTGAKSDAKPAPAKPAAKPTKAAS